MSKKFWKLTYRGRFVLRQSRLHRGIAQVFLALFALLAAFEPAVEAFASGSAFEGYVSGPADPRGDTKSLVGVATEAVEDVEEDADEEEATFLGLTALHCARLAEYRAGAVWLLSFRRLSAHFCTTGPPIL